MDLIYCHCPLKSDQVNSQLCTVIYFLSLQVLTIYFATIFLKQFFTKCAEKCNPNLRIFEYVTLHTLLFTYCPQLYWNLESFKLKIRPFIFNIFASLCNIRLFIFKIFPSLTFLDALCHYFNMISLELLNKVLFCWVLAFVLI